MDTLTVLMRGEAARRAGNKLMVFDWDKAARLIVEHGAKAASAGLRGDWEWTGGEILTDGKPNTDDYTYLASIHAVPELRLDDGDPIPCYVTEPDNNGWDSDTKWPESARAILGLPPAPQAETIPTEGDDR